MAVQTLSYHKLQKNKNPWISRATLQLKTDKTIKEKNFNSPCKDNEICELTSKLKGQISSDRQRYYGDLLLSYITSAPDKFWRCISLKIEECDVFAIMVH